jgi:hypothetical protein
MANINSVFAVFDHKELPKVRSEPPRLPHMVEELRHLFLIITCTKRDDTLGDVTGPERHMEAMKRQGPDV